MNELENASIAGLIEAIKSRGHNLYMGIVDNEGMESLLLVDNFMIYRSRIDGKRIITIDNISYKVSETDHLGLCEIYEVIQSLENFRAFEKIVINSSYGASIETFNLLTI